ncbi:LTA synthase family protein [Porphyromonas sp.]|uniref:LTA synthase family protein n=1 Tax=Porphyromonas sp. TaxID=1924944 RepID=UPI0026DB9396|nr:alkaline phosphatase family protein [Porphyromonas sp.]MDO4770779.1 sulfatase-like hydrolase/transferase [Porphyromonas sp.]
MKALETRYRYLVFFYHLFLSWLMFNIGRLVFFVHNHVYYKHLSAGELWTAWLGGQRFDLAAMGYLNSIYMLLFVVLGFFSVKVRTHRASYPAMKWVFLIPNIAGIILNVGDSGYFPFVRKRMTSTVFQEFGEDNPVLLVLRLAWTNPVLTIIAIAMVITLIWAYPRIKYTSRKKLPVAWRVISSIIILLITVFTTVVSIRGGLIHSIRPLSPFNAQAYVEQVKDRDLVLNTPFCMIRTADKKVLKEIEYIPKEEAERLFSAHYKAQPLSETDSLFGAYKDFNVMILILESFAKEHIGAMQEDGKGYTPFFDTLINDPATVSWQYAFANGRKSIDAMPSIIASVPALGINFVTSNYSGNEIDGLGTCLRRHGYKDAYFMHGAPNGSMGFDAFSKHMGYTGYIGMTEYNNDDDYDNAWGIWDQKFLPFLPEQISRFSQPWLGTIFTLSSHEPFKLPKEDEGKYPKGDVPLQTMIAYSDDALKDFFERSRKEPWFDKTIFIITADHTSQSASPVYDNLPGNFAIPQLWYIPGKPLPKEDIYTHKIVQQADIYPSLLYLLGVEDEIISYGHNIFDPTSMSYAVISWGEDHLITKDSIYTFESESNKLTAESIKTVLLPANDSISSPKITSRHLPAIVMDYNKRLIHNQLSARYNQ